MIRIKVRAAHDRATTAAGSEVGTASAGQETEHRV
jgi:hypothetical protein